MRTPYQKLVHTLTGDNGKKLDDHEKITTALNAEFYFAPYQHKGEITMFKMKLLVFVGLIIFFSNLPKKLIIFGSGFQ